MSPDAASDTVMVDALLAEHARHWVVRLASGGISEDEMSRLQRWLQTPACRAAFDRQRALWLVAGEARAATVAPASSPGPVRRRRLPALAALAAMACVALLAGPALWTQWRSDHRSQLAPVEQRLDDGSLLALDAGSAVALAFDGRVRRVTLLHGRAWFEVAHGDARPFEVVVGDVRVRDVGTAFELARLAGGGSLAVSEGAVDLIEAPGLDAPLRLRQGDALRWDAVTGPLPRTAVRTDEVAAWRHGELLFDAMPVDAALQVLASYREAPLWLVGDFGDVAPVSATFRSDSVDEAIDVLLEQGRLRVLRLPGGGLLVRPPDA